MPVKLVADHIASQAGGFEPQRVNNWSIRITGLANADVIELSLSNFTPPKRNIEPLTIPYQNEERKVATRATYDNAPLTIRDYVDSETWRILWEWQEQVHNSETGAIGLASEYKKEGVLYYYGPNGQFERTWILQGIWPTSVGGSDLDQGGTEQNLITMEMAVDKWIADNLSAVGGGT